MFYCDKVGKVEEKGKCENRVGSNWILCTTCYKCVNNRCNGVTGSLYKSIDYR